MTRLRIVAFALVATLAVGCFAAPAPLPDPDPNQLEITEIIAPAGIAQVTVINSKIINQLNTDKLCQLRDN